MADEATKEAPAVEKQTNCLGCGKPLKKLKKYYRNGKFFCDKDCRKQMFKKQVEEKEQK